MKKILYFTGFALLAGLLVTSSCTKDEDVNPFQGLNSKGAVAVVTNVVNGFFDLASPATSSIAFDLNTKGETVSSVLVKKSVNGSAATDLTTITSFPSTYGLTFDEALAGTGIDVADLNPGDKVVLSFSMTTSSGVYPGGSLSIDMSCVSNLAGMYSVTATYSQHDFLPDYDTNTMDVEITEVASGVYSIEDFSGGLYGTGPYVAAYNTSGMPVEFKDVCNDISWEGQSDAWGGLSMTDGGVNSVDPTTGIITISWIADAYGESAVCVYTPL